MTMTTRSNVRIHLNGNYLGFRYGEERIILDEGAIQLDTSRLGPGQTYRGTAFVLSNTVRDQRQAARSLDDIVPVELHIGYDGTFTLDDRDPVIAVRSIPSFPDRELVPGDTWEAYGQVVVDPFQDGVPTTVPVLIAYRFDGFDSYLGEPAAVISAQYALRYRQGQDRRGDPELQTIQGRHILQIFMSADGSRPLFIRDTLQDQFLYRDGTRVEMSGFRLTFFDTPRSRTAGELRERLTVRPQIREQLPPPIADPPAPGLPSERPDSERSDPPGIAEAVDPGTARPGDPADDPTAAQEQITIEQTDLGLRLSLPSIRFVADQAVVLPAERDRLSSLAEALQEGLTLNPDASFMIVGHTADIGLAENQQRLSEERASAIVAEMVQRGLPADRFLYQGRGGREPIADNDTPVGRALNRRVEVYIIE